MQIRDRLLPRDEVVQIVGASVPTIYRWMAAGLFPRPIPVGPRAVRWMESEVYEWIENRKLSRAA
ncbi:AlpA family phage regulatory protein [Shimia sp. R9_2]|uniref:helix-turn-helix transcriptional regulator n=1 Tax=Shimia sp. R9_2 TaxID=2821112 RepID=UPI001ADB2409|nr:AlpA family phage regulatory protein [Shimia sp. R9_2]MBO9398230.1 AlpA family phage regulatory protein [Shimia sp. R9_2]